MKLILLTLILLPNLVVAEPSNDNDRIELKSQEIVAILAHCESSNRPNIVIMDTNGLRSYGLLQFQKWIWEHWTEYYALKDRQIMNPEHQKELALKMVADGQGKVTWRNCWKKYNLESY